MIALVVLQLLASTSPNNALPPAAVFATRYGDAVVEVAFDVDGAGPKKPQRSQGFFVSSSGLLCSVLEGADAGDIVEIEAEVGRIAGTVVCTRRSETGPPAGLKLGHPNRSRVLRSGDAQDGQSCSNPVCRDGQQPLETFGRSGVQRRA
jgi:hypothetical protein